MNNHRYVLRRDWSGAVNSSQRCTVNFVMLNPSTADDLFDDPTIRKCVGFSKRWGFSGLVVTNLFAYRATDPRELIALVAKDSALAIGDENNEHLKREAANANSVVFAWGNHADKLPARRSEVIEMLQAYKPLCIQMTKAGNPAHPVRSAYTDSPDQFFRPTTSPERHK